MAMKWQVRDSGQTSCWKHRLARRTLAEDAAVSRSAVLMFWASLALYGTSVVGHETSCEAEPLSKGEIKECESDGKGCDGLGAVNGRVAVYDSILVGVTTAQDDSNELGNLGTMRSNLLKFEIDQPRSVRISGVGVERRQLVSLEDGLIKAEYGCVSGRSILLEAGKYILKNWIDVGQAKNGTVQFSTVIDFPGPHDGSSLPDLRRPGGADPLDARGTAKSLGTRLFSAVVWVGFTFLASLVLLVHLLS